MSNWLSTLNSEERKKVQMFRALFKYFPNALALIARHSVWANDKHNPGEEVHWAKEKSPDHDDCILRHTSELTEDMDSKDEDGAYHIIARAWRANAALEMWALNKLAKGEKIEFKS